VLASTSSPHPIVGHEELELVMAARDRRPLLLIDIAVPLDIDPLCAQLEGVTLRDIDDLQAAVTHNISSRAADIPAAEEIIGERSSASQSGSDSWTCARRSAPCTSAASESSSMCSRRTRTLGVTSARDSGACRGARPGGRRAHCCMSRRSACEASIPNASTAASRCCATVSPCVATL